MKMDNDTKEAIKSKFLLGGSQDDVIPKQTLIQMSSSLTSIETSFNELRAYTGNILRVQKAMQKAAIVSMKKAKSPMEALQALEGGSEQSSSSEKLTAVFPQLTQIIDQLEKSLKKLDMTGNADAPTDKAMGTLGRAAPAAPVEDPQQEVKAENKKKAKVAVERQNKRTESTRRPPKPATEIAQKSSVKTSRPQAPSIPKSETKAEKQLTQAATRSSARENVGATAAAKPQPTGSNQTGSGWGEKLSGFIGKSVTNVKSSIAEFLSNMGSILGIGGGAVAGGAAGYAAGGGGGGGDQNLPQVTAGDGWIMEMVKRHEGVRNNIYKDSVGLPTFGVGHLITRNDPEHGRPVGTPVSPQRVNEVFTRDYASHKRIAERTPGYNRANAMGKGAMVDLAFNMGQWWPRWPSTSRALESGNWQEAATQMQNSRWARQVGGRARTITGMIARAGGASPAPMADSGSTAGQAPAGAPSGRQAPGARGFNDNVRAVSGNIRQYASFGSSVNFEGLRDPVKRRFTAMAAEHFQNTGRKVQINSAHRSRADQERMWRTYGPRRAAPPGRSLHESGVAIDVNTPDVQRLERLGLLRKYGFWLPYFPRETWHLEPVEGSRVGGQPDNPYQPGAPIAQREGGREVVQDSTGANRAVTAPRRQLGPAASGAAIQRRVGDNIVVQNQAAPIIAPSSNPMGYLTGMKPPKGATKYNVNTAEDYKIYFNAA